MVNDPTGEFILEDKSQILSIVDFRNVPRNEGARQQARRELVIQMLIAESMTNWDQLYKRLKHEEKAKKRAERRRLAACARLHSSASASASTSSTTSTTTSCRSLLSHSDFNYNNKLSIINDISFNYKWKRTLKHCMGRGAGMVGGESRNTLRESVCSSTNDLHIWQLPQILTCFQSREITGTVGVSLSTYFKLIRVTFLTISTHYYDYDSCLKFKNYLHKVLQQKCVWNCNAYTFTMQMLYFTKTVPAKHKKLAPVHCHHHQKFYFHHRTYIFPCWCVFVNLCNSKKTHTKKWHTQIQTHILTHITQWEFSPTWEREWAMPMKQIFKKTFDPSYEKKYKMQLFFRQIGKKCSTIAHQFF